jgi:TolA-binding protein
MWYCDINGNQHNLHTNFSLLCHFESVYFVKNNMERDMKRSMVAVLAALIITACVGVSIFAVGGAALFNKNGSPASNSPAQAVNVSSSNSSQQTDQFAQLQNLISQYQDREKQYQQREQQLQSQLAQANAQVQADQQTVQQAQALLDALQQRGLIRITDDGRIFINQ